MPADASKKASSSPAAGAMRRWQSVLAVALGSLVTLAVYNYQFGQGNHCVYLLDALRHVEPGTLAHDWFTTHTLQYHLAFTWLCVPLMHLGILKPAFLVLYCLLILAQQVSWRGIVRHLGGGDAAYLASVVLYYLAAAGTALGMYQFFQDSSLLPSNIANVVLLAGVWLALIDRPVAAGACFGVAGAFHLNHAIVGPLLWIALFIGASGKYINRRFLLPSAIAMLPGAINIACALHSKLAGSGSMPLSQFIDVYVRIRHPHHYDPSTWPLPIWIAFALPAMVALLWTRGRLRQFVVAVMILLAAALLGAGVWYINETLVQLSLYRFSIYVQLVGCIVAGVHLANLCKRLLLPLAAMACFAMVVAGAVRGPYFGAVRLAHDDDRYRQLCAWASRNTPENAVFVVPPDEESMRLIGRRAIVVNYKAVPQLGAELAEWNRRLCDVLDVPGLDGLAGDYNHTLAAIRGRYDELTAPQLTAVADRYGARYLVTRRPLLELGDRLLHAAANDQYYLYDLKQHD